MMTPKHQYRNRSGTRRHVGRAGMLLLTAAAASAPAAAMAAPWSSWRGPEQNGFAREDAAVTTWKIDGENQLWKSPVGGRSTPILMNGRLYAITPAGEGTCVGERIICMDAETGKTIWAHKFNVFLTDIVENRIGWTAVAGDPETGFVYAHGTGGELMCLDGKDGAVVWQRSLGEMFGRYSGYGGRLHSPIVDEDRVVISIVYILSNWGTGKQKASHRYLAFDKRTGELLWSSMPGVRPLDTTYAVPVVTVIDGRRLLIAPNADGNVYAMLARTGEPVWSFKLAKRGLNSSPVVHGRYAYVTHSEENLNTTRMGAVVCLDASRTGDITDSGVVWRHDGVTAGYSSPAIANGRLYAIDNSAEMYCYDAKTGEQYWSHRLGRVMKGSPVVTKDGVIYVGVVNGVFQILRDEGDHVTTLSTVEFTRDDNQIVEIFGSPIVKDGRVYFMHRYGTLRLGAKSPAQPAESVAMAEEAAPNPDKPTHVRVVPAEVTLAPGEQVTFAARLYDANGRLLGTPKAATWSVKGVAARGDAKSGMVTAATDPAFSAGTVSVAADGLTGTARLRVCPPLPIHETFDKMPVGQPPPGWLGVDLKTAIVEEDGNRTFRKLAKSPSAPYMRMRAFSIPPQPIGHTVEADMKATPRRGRRVVLPDMGLINCRYQFIMEGQSKQLLLSRWKNEPVHGLRRRVPFEMKPGVWYRAKLRSELHDGTARLRAKVWPRDEDEPAGWSIELEDDCPNLEGSPGMHGYSNGTTVKKEGAIIDFDNYRVYLND